VAKEVLIIGYIDLHAHILPGLDDGAQTVEESVEMARKFVECGYGAVVATPHVIDGAPSRELILERCRALRQVLADEGVGLQIYPGAEIYLDYEFMNQLKMGEFLGLGGEESLYLLLELEGMQPLPVNLESIFFELNARGYRVVISHPERVPAFQENLEVLYRLVHKGALCQVTLGSLTGLFGPGVEETAKSILEHKMAHFLVTDAHGDGQRLAAITDAVKVVWEKWDINMEFQLLVKNPGCVLDGKVVDADDPVCPDLKEEGRRRKRIRHQHKLNGKNKGPGNNKGANGKDMAQKANKAQDKNGSGAENAAPQKMFRRPQNI